jgi:drug/metabolite transporter (DMT)-like permease/2-polyprenyl-3-methyl-5-hydroxy-6-metoxy-1,4-benzoquinol methylase
MKKHRSGLLFGFASALLMAFTPLLNKLSIESSNLGTSSITNSLLSFIFSLLLFWKSRKTDSEHQLSSANSPIFFVGIFNGIGMLLMFFSLEQISPSISGFYGQSYTIFAVGFAVIFLKEKIQQIQLLFLSFIIFGGLLFSYEGSISNNYSSIMLIVFSAFCFAASNFLAKKSTTNQKSEKILLLTNFSSLLVTIMYWILHDFSFNFSLHSFSFNIISAAIGSFGGMLLFYKSLDLIGFSYANLIRSINPVAIFLFSYPFFPVNLEFISYIGASLIILGLMGYNLVQINPKDSTPSDWDKVWDEANKTEYAIPEIREKISEKKIEVLSKLFDLKAAKSVLEAGCGDGELLRHLKEKYPQLSLYGVDVSEVAVEKCKKMLKHTGSSGTVIQCSIEKIPIKSDWVDLVICLGVIEHFSKNTQKEMVCELVRVVQPSGTLIMMTPNKYSFGVIDRNIKTFLGKWPFGYQKEMSTHEIAHLFKDLSNVRVSKKLSVPVELLLGTRTPLLFRLIAFFDSFMAIFIKDFGFYSYVSVIKTQASE